MKVKEQVKQRRNSEKTFPHGKTLFGRREEEKGSKKGQKKARSRLKLEKANGSGRHRGPREKLLGDHCRTNGVPHKERKKPLRQGGKTDRERGTVPWKLNCNLKVSKKKRVKKFTTKIWKAQKKKKNGTHEKRTKQTRTKRSRPKSRKRDQLRYREEGPDPAHLKITEPTIKPGVIKRSFKT